MRLVHRIPVREQASAVLDDRYAAEVDRSTRRAERAYAKAVLALERAERKLRQALQQRDKRAIRVANELAELRRAELVELEAMMKAVPASAAHRGVKSFRPVPPPG